MRASGVEIDPCFALIAGHSILCADFDAGSGGKAAQVASFLRRAGFVVLAIKPAPAGFLRSEILWGHGSGTIEAVLGSYLTTLPAVYDNAHTTEAVQVVVIGPDFKGAG